MIPAFRILRAALAAFVFVFALCGEAEAQSALLQGGPWVPGHIPQYVGQGSSQPVVIDGGGAGGGGIGVTLGEIGVTSRDPNNIYPSVNSGTGPYGSHFCLYDAPTNNPSGYHVLCLDPNAQGGGLLSYGVGGVASQLPLQCEINGVLSNCFSGGGSGALTIGTTPVNGAPPGAFLTSNGTTLEYSLGTPVVAAIPTGSYQNFFAVTWTGSGNVTLAAFGGEGVPGFTQANVGNDIVCSGIGALENQAYAGVIASVVNGTTVTLVPAPTITMTAQSQRCAFGPDQTANLQTTFNLGQSTGLGSYVPGGIYLVNQALVCLPPVGYNNPGNAPPLCQFGQGAVLIYAGAAQINDQMTYGSATAPQFVGRLTNAEVEGGTFDGNFNVLNNIDLPFFLQMTRRNQTTKNALQHGVRAGDVASLPTASSGLVDMNNFGLRDINYIPIVSVTSTTPAVVTTAYPHGFTTGRVVWFTGTNGSQAGLNTTWWQITVTGPTTFTLNNSALTGSAASTGLVNQTMPSMAVEQPVYGITNANPAVVTAPAGTVTSAQSGSQFFIADASMANAAGTANCVDGTFVATYVSPTTFSIPVDSSTCPSYAGGGRIIPAPQFNTLESLIYNENATDEQIYGDEFYGVRIGVTNNAATSGYDGKFQFHVYNYFQDGELLAAFYGGGTNYFPGLQTDCPARFSVWLTGPFNSSTGSEMNCNAQGVFVGLINNLASFARLEADATFTQYGGVVEGSVGHNVLQMVSSPNAVLGQYGAILGYNQANVAQYYVNYGQPDSFYNPNFQVFSPVSSVGLGAVSTASGGTAQINAWDTNSGHYGLQMQSGNNGAALNLLTNALSPTFDVTEIFMTPSLIAMEEPVQLVGIPTSAGGGGLYVCVDSAGLTYKKSSCP